MPEISFVMPAKNAGKYIEASIKSIVEQTYKDWELIIIDHSDPDDKSKEIIDSFNDPRIKLYRLPTAWDGGIPVARNFGNVFASAPIIAVADADDIYRPNRAELTLEAFKEEKCDVFYGLVEEKILETGEIRQARTANPVVPFDLEIMKKYNIIPHSSSAYRREIAYQFPYNSFFLRAEDYELFVRLAYAGKRFYFCNEIIYQYLKKERRDPETVKLQAGLVKMIGHLYGWNNGKSDTLKEVMENND